MSIDNVKVNIGNAEIGFETGKLALQAPGSVAVSYTHLRAHET